MTKSSYLPIFIRFSRFCAVILPLGFILIKWCLSLLSCLPPPCLFHIKACLHQLKFLHCPRLRLLVLPSLVLCGVFLLILTRLLQSLDLLLLREDIVQRALAAKDVSVHAGHGINSRLKA